MPCYFLIDNFDCETTLAEKCLTVLRIRMDSGATPEEEKKFFEPCAGEIYKKDAYVGAQAQALIQQKLESKEPGGQIETFADYLPTFKYREWETFIREKYERINAFKLSRYLKERWGRLEPQEKAELIPGVEQIIVLVENTYPNQRKRLSQALRIVRSEILDIRQVNREENTRETIKAQVIAKNWEELNDYIAGLDTSRCSYDLLELVNEARGKAEEGVLWLQRRKILEELEEKAGQQAPESFYREYLEARPEIRSLVENLAGMAGRETAADIQNRIERIYAAVLKRIKEWENTSEIKFQQLKLWEEELRLLNLHQPGDWDAYAQSISHDLVEILANEFSSALKNGNTLEEIKLGIEQVINNAVQLDLKKDLEEYKAGDQDESILEICRHLEEWNQFDRTLERFFTTADPFNLAVTLDRQPGDLEQETNQAPAAAALYKTREKYRAAEEVIRCVRTTVELLESLVTAMKKEAKSILYNKPVIKLEGFQRQLKALAAKTSQVLEKHKQQYTFAVLDNLEKIIVVTGGLLFGIKKSPGTRTDDLGVPQNSFLKSLREYISCGEALLRDLKQLKPRLKEAAVENPAAIQDEFFQVIDSYREKEFLITMDRVQEAADLYETLMKIIHERVENYLKPVRASLGFPFPLVEEKDLEEFKVRIHSLQKQIEKIEISYPGYEELIEPYKDELGQWNQVIQVHEAIRQEKFDEASRIVETTAISDPEVRYPARVAVYYYRYLYPGKWNEEQWLKFFNHYSLDSLKTNETGYKVLLSHYRKEARKNFQHFSITTIETHYRVFKIFSPTDGLVPYLAYLSRQIDTKEFFKALQGTSARPEAFQAMVDILEKSREWNRYIDLYRHSTPKYKNYFEKPVTRVTEDLEAQAQELIKRFTSGNLHREEIDAYIDRIPPDREFQEISSKSKRLHELFDSYREIAVQFKHLESEDIWMQDDFYRQLYQALGRHTDKFTGEFSGIREANRWEARVASLRKIYDLGRELREQMDKLVQTDASFDIKAEETYSQALRNAIKEILSTWNRFVAEIALMSENTIFKKNFQHYHLAHLVKLWRKMSLYHLCETAKIETPRDLDNFFTLWERILKNHETFVTHYYKNEGLQNDDLGKVEVLDEFIRLTVERLKQQGRLKE
jgi:hypothetical protein